MEYPKRIMKKSELIDMGFPSSFLGIAYRKKGQTFANKVDPRKRNSTLMFDTVGLEKYRLSLTAVNR